MGNLTPQAFSYVAELVRREAAIVLGPGKEYLVEARLTPLARAAGAADVSAYVSTLQSPARAKQRMAVVEALTTNETSWFRDGEPFEALRTTVVPQLLTQVPPSRRVNVWSAACSSGQEAYTIAMVMAEHAGGRKVDILASDLSQEMLDRTKAGSYSQLEVGRGLPAPMMVKHFRRSGTQWQVSEQLRSMVRTQRINLATPFPPLPVFDVVFLRNVLIYFDTPTKRAILQRVRQVLSPQGFLFLGGAETTIGIDDGWDRTTVGRFTLYRPASAADPTPVPVPSLAWAATAEGR
ncbi:MAG TPA: protein-glutamate O-methyltransferase CheR [Marmoricola sp.]|nr:protein-glutamate O-methyltransferase CheR [Marmoricola sp.]